MVGVMSRMTMTFSGSEGIRDLDDLGVVIVDGRC